MQSSCSKNWFGVKMGNKMKQINPKIIENEREAKRSQATAAYRTTILDTGK